MESFLQGVWLFFYWVGVIICAILAYTLPVWGFTRYERSQLHLEQEKLDADKAEFAKQIRSQETFNKALDYMNAAYQKQTQAVQAYKEALLTINKADEMRQQSDLKVEQMTEKNTQLRYELENSRERTKRLARKLAAANQSKNFQPDTL
jgi:predicted RNase H-like nuclease (RuvC/YqgF family)